MKHLFTILLVFSFHIIILGQKTELLPRKNLWQTQTLDPIASQGYGQISASWEESDPSDFAVAAFAIGFQKSMLLWQFGEGKALDLGIEGSVFTQFEWTWRDDDFQRNLLSNDFMIAAPLVLKIDNWTIRLRFYHLSSHMGDDYIIRNNIQSYVKNNNNYEQIDLTSSYLLNNFRFNFGIGVVTRSSNTREPMVFTGGTEYLLPLNKQKSVSYYAGFYIDSKQEFDFRPAINMGTGIQLGKPDRRPVKILFTYFNGPLPYSVYHGNLVQWLGATIYITPV